MRTILTGALAGALTFGLASCGSVQEPAPQAPPPGPDAGAFPVSIKHKFGDTTIPAQPKRVAVIGTSTDDLDAAYALGVTPVAFFSKDQTTPDGKYPWLQGKLDPARTQVVNAPNGVNPEQVAAVQPDLILATGDFGLEQEYPNLSKIAPTVGYESEWGKQSWQQHVEVAGKALGRSADARRIIGETEGKIAQVRNEHPALAGKTFSVSLSPTPGKALTLVSPEDFAVKQIEQLGLKLSPSLADVQRMGGSPTGTVGAEQFDKLGADFVVNAYGTPDAKAAFENSPLMQNVPALKKGAYVVADMQTITQLRYPSVLGIPWALDKLAPGLEKAAHP